MNRTLAHLLGWGSLAIGALLVAIIVLTPPWLELHYANWERDLIDACAVAQREQVAAYEDFASALSSNDPILLQRLAYHHLRLKPSRTEFVAMDRHINPLVRIVEGHAAASLAPDPAAGENTLLEEWLHKPHPIVGIDHPPYQPPDHMLIRLATGSKRLILLGLGGVFLLCGLVLPGPAPAIAASAPPADADDFVTAVLDEEEDVASAGDDDDATEESTA